MPAQPVIARVFSLQPYGGLPFTGVVITPEELDANIVTAAWAYAVRYTAKGLDLPDHDAALKLLQERHPSWHVIASTVAQILVNLPLAEKDQPET